MLGNRGYLVASLFVWIWLPQSSHSVGGRSDVSANVWLDSVQGYYRSYGDRA